MSKSKTDGATIKKIAAAIQPVVARMMAAKTEDEVDKIGESELAEVLGKFTKSPASRTATLKVKAVRKTKAVMAVKGDFAVTFTAHLIAGSMTVATRPPPPQNTPQNGDDCDAWWDLYGALVDQYIGQLDSWTECLAGPTSGGGQSQVMGDVWPGIPDVLLGESSLGRCGGAWDAMAETGQELESMEFAMRSAGCM
jgi:hypothetical protein